MPSKLQTYMQMADEAQRQITGSYRGWTGFLTTAARLYKYPYAEQVMIHAQRPDATACAEYDFWNEKMGRYVRRGSKGIALIDSSGERPRLRYVFDVSDTGGREFPKSRYLWEYREEHADAVSAMLESRYGVDGKGGLPDQLERIASQLAEEYWRDYKRDNNRYEALSWICKNQLGRRNLTPQQKKYLIGERYDAEKKAHGGDRKSGQVKSTVQNEPLISSHMTRAQIAEDTKTSESYVMRADLYAKGVNAAEEVLPGIKNDLLSGKYKPRETDVAAVARASPEERREKAEQLRVFPEKKPKADKESARSGTKRQQEVYATIDKSYEDMKDSKRVTEDSALVSLRYTARNMVETCDVLFTNFPGLLEKPDYKDQVIEIMQEPKQYILKLEGETDNEQH